MARDPERFGPEVGWRELFAPIARLGMSADDWMVRHYVIEADPRLERFADNPVNTQVIYDVDNLSDGTATFSCGPSDWSAASGESRCPADVAGQEVFFPLPHAEDPDQALRLDRQRLDGSFDAFRVPVLRPAGQHGIYNAQPFRVFDADAFAVNFTVRFLGTGGGDVSHEPGCDCTGTEPTFLRDGAEDFPGIGRQCGADDMNVCDGTCLEGWGIRAVAVAECLVGG